MAKYLIEQMLIEKQFEEVLAKSRGEFVTVTYNGQQMTLTEALSKILTSVNAAQTSEQVQAAVKAQFDKIVGGASDAYDTLLEIETLMKEHDGAYEALLAAVNKKVDASDLGTLAKKSNVAEDDLDTALKAKIHTHSNQTVLDGITSGKVSAWDAKLDESDIADLKSTVEELEEDSHTHSNKEVLDGITSGKVSAWDAKLDESDIADLKSTIEELEEDSHTHSNNEVLDGITSGKVSAWDAKAEKTEASESAAGLMSADDKKRLNGLRGVRYGTEPPKDMKDGELFVRVIED